MIAFWGTFAGNPPGPGLTVRPVWIVKRHVRCRSRLGLNGSSVKEVNRVNATGPRSIGNRDDQAIRASRSTEAWSVRHHLNEFTGNWQDRGRIADERGDRVLRLHRDGTSPSVRGASRDSARRPTGTRDASLPPELHGSFVAGWTCSGIFARRAELPCPFSERCKNARTRSEAGNSMVSRNRRSHRTTWPRPERDCLLALGTSGVCSLFVFAAARMRRDDVSSVVGDRHRDAPDRRCQTRVAGSCPAIPAGGRGRIGQDDRGWDSYPAVCSR